MELGLLAMAPISLVIVGLILFDRYQMKTEQRKAAEKNRKVLDSIVFEPTSRNR